MTSVDPVQKYIIWSLQKNEGWGRGEYWLSINGASPGGRAFGYGVFSERCSVELCRVCLRLPRSRFVSSRNAPPRCVTGPKRSSRRRKVYVSSAPDRILLRANISNDKIFFRKQSFVMLKTAEEKSCQLAWDLVHTNAMKYTASISCISEALKFECVCMCVC